MVLSLNILILFVVALVVSSIGFKNYVWFISLGYGFSIAAEGIAMFVLYGSTMDIGTVILSALLIVYGCRLGGYLAFRESRVTTYSKNMKGEIKDGKTVKFPAKLAIWISCAALYVFQVLAINYRLANAAESGVMAYVGAAVMAFGVILESTADIQKNRAKKVNSRRFVDTGLYRFVRCPNYLGELIFWTGVLLSGIGGVYGVGQWIMTAVGYIGIVYIMFSGARRLEIRQDKNYGNDPEYQKYVKSVPIMIPFIPLYSVKKHKWLVG